jgi:hypothetical protein
MPKESFQHYLELELEDIIRELKDEIKEKAIFKSIRDGNNKIGANCNRLTNPPTITIHINSLEETFRPSIKKAIEHLLNHEIIHAIQEPHNTIETIEKEAYTKQDKVNFKK